MEIPKSPINNLFSVLTGFKADHEKALKQGIYNAIGLFLLCLICAASYGLYLIFHPFVKPLIWALLCGSVLFPFKLYITDTVKTWFEETENSNEPFLVNLAVVPLKVIDKISESIGSFLYEKIRYILISLVSISSVLLLYWYTPTKLTCLTWKFMQFGGALVSFFVTSCNIYTIFPLAVGYISALFVYWTPENATSFNYASIGIWIIFSFHVSNILGVYQVAIFCALQFLCIIGFIYEVVTIVEKNEMEGKIVTYLKAARCALIGCDPENVVTNISKEEEDSIFNEEVNILEENVESIDAASSNNDDINSLKMTKKTMSLDLKSFQVPTLKTDEKSGKTSSHWTRLANSRESIIPKYRQKKLSLDILHDNVDADKYMYGAIYACIGMLLWKQKWILLSLTFPIIWYISKQLGKYFGFLDIVQSRINFLICHSKVWYQQRQVALIPAHVKGLYKVYIIVDKKMRQILKGSVDTVATITVILGLIIFVFCASIFIVIQIYAEGTHLIQVTGEILNSTLMNNPDFDWLPQQWEESVNSVLDNTYTYGRTAISDGVKGLVKDMEASKAEMVEKKVLELWDRLYQAWMMSNESPNMIGPTVNFDAAIPAWEGLRESFKKLPTQMFNMDGIQSFAKQHVGILLSVLDSIWGIIKGNMSVVMSIFTELLYLVLISGSALLNFTLSTVVFFTTLFYLLSSSERIYKPIDLMAHFSPISCYRFAIALQQAVIGVFAATFKLASFFGMWTWFIHNLFQVKIVYLPSAFASVLAAVPFLDAYFACIPATIELWFTRGPFIAVIFFIFHFLPCNIVITDFYKGIKNGGHPYLTGLSIAGGIFCLGAEGAIFGPLLLCCIMVVINLSRKYLRTVPTGTFDSLKTQITQLQAEELLDAGTKKN